MPRRTPSLQAVESFLVAARLRSFRAAADHMAISVAAFSRRIQQLECAVGTPLFERWNRGVRLTSHGERYLIQIEEPIASIRNASTALRSSTPRARPLVRIATSQSFASNWLLPRLPVLRDTLDIEAHVRTSRDVNVLESGDVDVAIWGGRQALPRSEELFATDAVPVIAAHVSLPLQHIEQIGAQRLLGVREPERIWDRWFDATGHGAPIRCPTDFDTLRLMYESAAAGLGITLAIPVISEPYLETGMLRACATQRSPLGLGYRLYFHSAATAKLEAVVRLRDWLHRQIDRSQRRFDQWWAAQLSQLTLLTTSHRR